jgi:NADH-quinone oxidoreductase subunit N
MNALISLAVLGIALIYTELSKEKKKLYQWVALVGIAITAALTLADWGSPTLYFNKLCTITNYGIAFNITMLLSMLMIVGISRYYYNDVKEHVSEIMGLMVFSIFGGYLITSYSNLIMLYLGIETLSIPLYVLAGSKKLSFKSNEASFKYFVMGGVASAILLLGITLTYGATGTFSIDAISPFIASAQHIPSIFVVGMMLILVGLLFKAAAMPFHFWAPDVYDGSPTLVTAFMATVVKIAVYASFYLLFSTAFVALTSVWAPVVWVAAALTLIGSNVVAINQKSAKRLMAYASISSSGFLLLGILACNSSSAPAILFYLVSYVLAAIPAFAAIIAVRKCSGNDSFDAFNGLVKRNKTLAITLAIALISLAGIPFTAGFFGKYYLFLAAIRGGYVWITIIAVAAAILSIYYFFRLLNRVFTTSGDEAPIELSLGMKVVLIASSAATILLGLLPDLVATLL